MSLNRRARSLFATALAASLFLVGCASTEDNPSTEAPQSEGGATLVIAEDSQPLSGFDPIMAQAFNAKRMVSQFYEGLLSLGEDGETLEPAIASGWEQLSPTEYVFTLREGVKFHNGEDVTAEDVVYSLERIVDPEQHSPYASLYRFDTIEATADDEVTITLTGPQASLLHLLAQPWSAGIVNKEWMESTDEDALKTQVNGTGPFMLESFQEGALISTVRFEDYWDGDLPHLDRVEYRVMADESTRVQALNSGTVDMVQLNVPRNAEAVKNGGNEVGPDYSYSYWVGLDVSTGPLANEKVRQAVSLGLDRQQLIEIGAQGVGELSYTIPPADPLGAPATEDSPFYRHDPEEARRLLAESGEDDVSLTMVLQSENPTSVPTAQLMSEQLREIGIDLRVEQIPFSTLVSNLLSGDWGADMIQLNAVLNADASQYLALWFAEGAQSTKVEDEQLWAMMDEAVATEDGNEARRAMYAEISEYIAENVYQIVPYASPYTIEAWSPELQDYTADATGTRIFLKHARIEG